MKNSIYAKHSALTMWWLSLLTSYFLYFAQKTKNQGIKYPYRILTSIRYRTLHQNSRTIPSKSTMPLPTQAKDFPNSERQKLETTILLAKLSNGDRQWEDRVTACSQNPDDPPILPGWNLAPCEEFFDKAVAYGGIGGPVLPPPQVFAGAHPVGPVTTALIQQMQLEIL